MVRIESDKIAHAEDIKIASFKYYATLSWMLRSLRGGKPIDWDFFRKSATQRYHDIYTKVYVGYVSIEDFNIIVPTVSFENSQAKRAIVAIEKDHTGGYFLTYFLRHSGKKLDNVTITAGVAKVAKKDPLGITLTEMNHLDKMMDESFVLTLDQHCEIEKTLKTITHK